MSKASLGYAVANPTYRLPAQTTFARLTMATETHSPEPRFAVCIDNHDYEASLETGKLYRILADQQAESHGYLRVIDEIGEDYGYSKNRFFILEIPKALEEVLFEKMA
jgi:hypothetical protein